MIKENAPEVENNQGIKHYINIDLVGNKAISNPVFRMFQCRICRGSFKRSQGALLISGFRCFADLPDTWPGSE